VALHDQCRQVGEIGNVVAEAGGGRAGRAVIEGDRADHPAAGRVQRVGPAGVDAVRTRQRQPGRHARLGRDVRHDHGLAQVGGAAAGGFLDADRDACEGGAEGHVHADRRPERQFIGAGFGHIDRRHGGIAGQPAGGLEQAGQQAVERGAADG